MSMFDVFVNNIIIETVMFYVPFTAEEAKTYLIDNGYNPNIMVIETN